VNCAARGVRPSVHRSTGPYSWCAKQAAVLPQRKCSLARQHQVGAPRSPTTPISDHCICVVEVDAHETPSPSTSPHANKRTFHLLSNDIIVVVITNAESMAKKNAIVYHFFKGFIVPGIHTHFFAAIFWSVSGRLFCNSTKSRSA
jgi:hypothetical protein